MNKKDSLSLMQRLKSFIRIRCDMTGPSSTCGSVCPFFLITLAAHLLCLFLYGGLSLIYLWTFPSRKYISNLRTSFPFSSVRMDLHINSPDSRRTNSFCLERVVEGAQMPPELEAGGSRMKKRRRSQSTAVEVPVSPSSDQMSKQSFDCQNGS